MSITATTHSIAPFTNSKMTHALRTLTVSALDGTRIACQLLVGKPPPRHAPERLLEPVGVLAVALVEPSRLHAKGWLNSQLVHLLYQHTDVVTEHLAQRLVDLPGITLAAQGAPELPFYHAVGRFDVGALVVVL